jgi:hypothetical protein
MEEFLGIILIFVVIMLTLNFGGCAERYKLEKEIKASDPIVIEKIVYRCSPDNPKGAR